MKRWLGSMLTFKSVVDVVGGIYVYCRLLWRKKLFRYLLIFITCVYIVFGLYGSTPEIILPRGVDISKFPPFEPEVTSDVSQGDGGGSKIPRIIHQTWRDANIPSKFVNNIKSFTKNNPSWQYYLWTDEAIYKLIDKHFPNLLPVWDSYVYSYHHRLRRFNAARYVIMYVYGGIYADMDTVNYRPLDRVTQHYNCILPTEPFEQTYNTFMSFSLTNSIMICKPKHPFFKFIIDNLHTYVHLSHSWDSAGPGYLTSQYRLYTGLPKTGQARRLSGHGQPRPDDGADSADSRPYMVRNDFALSDPDAIYVPNTHYFTGNSDTSLHNNLRSMCNSFHTQHYSVQRVCADLSRRGLVRKRSSFTYTEHLWQNNWYGWTNFYIYTRLYTMFFSTDIHDVVPHCKIPFVEDTL